MNKGWITYKRMAATGLVFALVLFVLSVVGVGNPGDTSRIAEVTSARVAKRLEVLDGYIDKTLQMDKVDEAAPMRIPDDMVMYHYVNDSLLTWNNQFPILNDRISTRLVFQRLTPVNNRLTSPLYDVGEEPEFMNLGSKWYVVKAVHGTLNDKVIAGLEIKNSFIDDFSRNENGVNERLKIPARYSVLPLTETGGSPVIVDGIPLFKIACDSFRQSRYIDNSVLKWFSLLLLIVAM